MRGTSMTPQKLLLPCLLLLTVLPALIIACGDDGEEVHTGNLTDPRSVPTSTPWPSPPDVIIIDPAALATLPPVAAGSQPSASATPAPAGICGATYTIASGDNFSTIAQKCGLSTQAIVDVNPGVDPKTLHEGQEIKLPPKPQGQ
ncbi:MAG: LysM peptidoglycan-binding domain-containing protein [Chloroflexi bacterium]|nr:MAG: LysM peptidoglycan-binding domain-containing protein [Chloroflexota bacterium]